MPPNLRRAAIWSPIALVVAAGLAWSFWPRSVPVDTARVTRAPMDVEISDEGRTRVRESYQVSAPVSGRLLRIDKHAGDQVIGGTTVVAEIMPSTPGFLDVRTRAQAESAVKSAEAARDLAASEVQRAKAELAYASNELQRAKYLIAADAISRATLDKAQLGYNTAATQLSTALAGLEAKKFDLETARALLIDPASASAAERSKASIPLIAPVSGRILRVLHENESVVDVGAPILEIGDPHNLEVVVDLISEDAVRAKPGDRAFITDWGGPGQLEARVRRIEPSGFTKLSALGVEEQRVNVLLDFTGPPRLWASLLDGFRVVAHIVVWHRPDTVQVPSAAMFRIEKGWAVFVLEHRRAVLKPIKVGNTNDEAAEVLSGLKPGDTVIVHPSDRVRDGVRVTVRAS